MQLSSGKNSWILECVFFFHFYVFFLDLPEPFFLDFFQGKFPLERRISIGRSGSQQRNPLRSKARLVLQKGSPSAEKLLRKGSPSAEKLLRKARLLTLLAHGCGEHAFCDADRQV